MDTTAVRRREPDESTLPAGALTLDRKSTRLNSSHSQISYAVFCLKKNRLKNLEPPQPRQGFARSSCRRERPRPRLHRLGLAEPMRYPSEMLVPGPSACCRNHTCN